MKTRMLGAAGLDFQTWKSTNLDSPLIRHFRLCHKYSKITVGFSPCGTPFVRSSASLALFRSLFSPLKTGLYNAVIRFGSQADEGRAP